MFISTPCSGWNVYFTNKVTVSDNKITRWDWRRRWPPPLYRGDHVNIGQVCRREEFPRDVLPVRVIAGYGFNCQKSKHILEIKGLKAVPLTLLRFNSLGWSLTSIFCLIDRFLYQFYYLGPFKRFQHLLQHAFNTLLNQMFGAFEQVVQHCLKHKKCRKLVESVLNPSLKSV